MLDSCLHRLARAIDAAPRLIAVICLAAAGLAAVVVARIPVTADLLDAMPEDNPAIVAFTDFLRDFGILNGLVVVVQSPTPNPEGLITAAQSLGERLSQSPYVASVDYNLLRANFRFAAEHFPLYLDRDGIQQLALRLTPEGVRRQMQNNRSALLSPLASPFEAEIIRRDPLNIRGLVRDNLTSRSGAPNLDLSTGYYLDASHRLVLLMVRPKGSSRDIAFVRSLQEEVTRLAAETLRSDAGTAGLRIGLAGGYARAAEALSVIWRDTAVSFVVSLVLVLSMLYAAFRPHPLVFGIFVVTLFAALAWTLLLAYAIYGMLNVVTSIVAAMLIGLFVDYIIQVYRRFEGAYRAEADPTEALLRTFAGTGKAVLSGALTTAVGFFAVVVTSFRGLHQLGVVAGFGILFCLLATLVLMMSLLIWLVRRRPTCLLKGHVADLGGSATARLVERHARLLVVAFSILVVCGLLGAMRVRFDASLDSMGLHDSAVQRVEERIVDVLGRRGEPLFVVARASDDTRLLKDFDAMEAMTDRWRATRAVGGVSSLGMLLPPPSAQQETLSHLRAAGLASKFTGPELARLVREEMDRAGLVSDQSVDGYAAGIARALATSEVVGLKELLASQDPRLASYYSPSARALAAHVTSPGPRWSAKAVSDLASEVRSLGSDFQLVGPALFLGEIRAAILWEAGLAVALTIGGNLLILRMHFVRWSRVWLVMLPVTVGVLLTVGAMGVLKLPFNFFNVAGIALIFGFGVDYGIYVMQAHVEDPSERKTGADAVRSVGGSVVLCAATTLASCGSLITSHYRGLASIGAVLCLGALFCLAATLLCLPALLGPGKASGARA